MRLRYHGRFAKLLARRLPPAECSPHPLGKPAEKNDPR